MISSCYVPSSISGLSLHLFMVVTNIHTIYASLSIETFEVEPFYSTPEWAISGSGGLHREKSGMSVASSTLNRSDRKEQPEVRRAFL